MLFSDEHAAHSPLIVISRCKRGVSAICCVDGDALVSSRIDARLANIAFAADTLSISYYLALSCLASRLQPICNLCHVAAATRVEPFAKPLIAAAHFSPPD